MASSSSLHPYCSYSLYGPLTETEKEFLQAVADFMHEEGATVNKSIAVDALFKLGEGAEHRHLELLQQRMQEGPVKNYYVPNGKKGKKKKKEFQILLPYEKEEYLSVPDATRRAGLQILFKRPMSFCSDDDYATIRFSRAADEALWRFGDNKNVLGEMLDGKESCFQILEKAEAEEAGGRGAGRTFPLGLFPDDDESMYGFGGGMLGFSGRDCDELLMQGVKPWDDDAADVLAVLNGGYDDFY